jgi:hypothetical protein
VPTRADTRVMTASIDHLGTFGKVDKVQEDVDIFQKAS